MSDSAPSLCSGSDGAGDEREAPVLDPSPTLVLLPNPATRSAKLRSLGVLFAVAIVGAAADQLTKWWALRALTVGDTDPPSILGGLVSLRLTFNSGAAFSMGSGATVLFASFSVLMAIAVVVYSLLRPPRFPVEAAMLGGLLAGICGNLVDRLFREPGPMRGLVVDFIAVDYFAIFNVADAFITCSVVALVIWQWRMERSA